MEHTRLLLAALLAVPLPAAAQVVAPRTAAPSGPVTRPSDGAVKISPPEHDCVCSRHNYKPLSAKGTSAKEYWDARGKARISRSVSGIAALFGMLAQSGATLNAAQDSYSRAMSELYTARAAAVAAGAVKVVGEDFEEESIEFLLVKGVDYVLTN